MSEAGVDLEYTEVGFRVVRVQFDLPPHSRGRVRGVDRECGCLEDLYYTEVGVNDRAGDAIGGYHTERAVRGDVYVGRRVRASGHVPSARHARQRVGLEEALGVVRDVARRPCGIHRGSVVRPVGMVDQRDVACDCLVGDVDQIQLRGGHDQEVPIRDRSQRALRGVASQLIRIQEFPSPGVVGTEDGIGPRDAIMIGASRGE